MPEPGDDLRATAAWIRFAQQIGRIGVFELSIEDMTCRWSEDLEALYGFEPGEYDGTLASWVKRLHPDDREEVAAVAQRCVQTGEVFDREFRIVLPDGTSRWMHGRCSLLQDGRGYRRMIGINVDVTERKEIERQQRFLAEAGAVLAASLDYEETLATVARLAVRELADFCIVDIVDDDGELRRLKVTSRDPELEWVCDLLQRLALDRTRPHLVRAAITTGTPALQHVTPDALAWLAQNEEHERALRGAAPRSVIAVPLVARGSTLGALAFVSSTRLYGQAEVRLATELGVRAALSIDNARLYRAATRATQARDDMLGIVAHDLRSPLNAIRLHAELLAEHGGERACHGAEQIARSAGRMNRLIEDLLDVTRIEANQLSIQQGPVCPYEIVADAVLAHAAVAAAAGVDLSSDLAVGLPALRADRERLLQIFENLLGNALKFTPGGGRIRIAARARDECAVQFEISDTGTGISSEYLAHLFDRFWQSPGCRDGAGLGLPIVRGLVHAHGGRIWVESTPGGGATFSFTIPSAT